MASNTRRASPTIAPRLWRNKWSSSSCRACHFPVQRHHVLVSQVEILPAIRSNLRQRMTTPHQNRTVNWSGWSHQVLICPFYWSILQIKLTREHQLSQIIQKLKYVEINIKSYWTTAAQKKYSDWTASTWSNGLLWTVARTMKKNVFLQGLLVF